jgi:hypothetical protein
MEGEFSSVYRDGLRGQIETEIPDLRGDSKAFSVLVLEASPEQLAQQPD